MGDEVNGINAEVTGVNTETGTETGVNSTSTSAADAGTGNRGRGRGRGRGTGNETGNETGEKVVPELVTVDTGVSEEEKKKAERNAKRRERYAKQKAEGQAKPRKVNKSKQPDPVINTEQINALIMSLSAIIASRPNCEQWLLTESEVSAITTPLMAILSESDKVELIAQNSNQIALAIACVSVFVPRIVVTVQKMKSEKEKQVNVRKAEQAKVDTEKLNKQHDRQHAGNDKGHSDVVPFYGLPIS